MTRLALILVLLATPVAAKDVVSPEEFEALSAGKTLYFTFEGRPYGAEQFYQGRRSLWQYSDGQCTSGEWQNDGNKLCFLYEENLELQCWTMFRENGELFVQSENATDDEALKLDRIDTVPLPCIGPDLGV